MLADQARGDLVPTVWVPPLDGRAIRGRLRRRSHLIRLRASSINRTFGLLTQWGLRRNLTALASLACLRNSPTMESPRSARLARGRFGVIDDLDRQFAPLERELLPLARAADRAGDDAAQRRRTARLASEIGDICRFPTAGKRSRAPGSPT